MANGGGNPKQQVPEESDLEEVAESLFGDDDELPILFDYYYNITESSPEQTSFAWTEFSYYKYDRPTKWDAYEKTELEIYEEQERQGIFNEGS